MIDADVDVRAELERISDDAGDVGVVLEIDLDSEGQIWIVSVERSGSAPKGSARRFLQRVCDLADEAGLEIRLAVLGWIIDLVAYYESLGFEIDADVSGSGRDPEYETMVRQPGA